MSESTEMPRYEWRMRHQKVSALKIKEVKVASDGTAVIEPVDPGFGEFDVEASYVEKYSPQPGGYYVQREGGDETFISESEFESEYARI